MTRSEYFINAELSIVNDLPADSYRTDPIIHDTARFPCNVIMEDESMLPRCKEFQFLFADSWRIAMQLHRSE